MSTTTSSETKTPVSQSESTPAVWSVTDRSLRCDYDVVIVGAGAAGLNAALVLGRARRRVLVIDSGEQGNKPAHQIGGLLGAHETSPSSLYAIGAKQLAELPSVSRRSGLVMKAEATTDTVTINYQPDAKLPNPTDGTTTATTTAPVTCTARRLVLAMGMAQRGEWQLSGARECWGRSLFHCPYCHGFEVRDQPLAVLDSGAATSVHRALLLRQWTADLILFTNGPKQFNDEQAKMLAAAGIKFEERPVKGFEHKDGQLTGIMLQDGTSVPRAGALFGTIPDQHAMSMNLINQLGLELTAALAPPPNPYGAHGFVAVDRIGRTSRALVWACGDLTAHMSVAASMGAGSMAGMMLGADLLSDDHGMPSHFPPTFTSVLANPHRPPPSTSSAAPASNSSSTAPAHPPETAKL